MNRFLLLVALCACGPPPKGPAPPIVDVHLGMTPNEVKEKWSDAHMAGSKGVVATYLEGAPATATFTFLDGHLIQVEVQLDAVQTSVTACAAEWKRIRERIDARFGESHEDNLAAYWPPSAGREIVLECNPTEDDRGTVVLRISRKTD